ncbi:Hpt domain-containing protein [Flavobacterium capsici]|uniref:Hpt domain-containing protein n=1 Tax=Flavobacterium capsici TaxID=3075618 RepID=A0AA96EV93_9FLAO|nr:MULTISPECIES: Hpt domain-containing protein [unclassified Flavobacterium]WNM18876.1 Hpt domain-containing protein [Flavobacterium sp. PMR2A8]WNM22926.1 Hpt domain-containing protein [Flavobacterium sp. PMTSA4]
MQQPNIEYFEKLSQGDEKIKEKFIKVLKYEFPIETEEYFQNLLSNNLETTANSVHKLKHKIAIVGLEDDYYMADKYEEYLKKGKTKYKESFEATLKTINQFISKI